MAAKRIALDETEIAALMKASAGRVLPLSFGPAGVWLNPSAAPWAVQLLAEWRGITFDAGAGI